VVRERKDLLKQEGENPYFSRTAFTHDMADSIELGRDELTL
jgi:hypothetical protein